MNYNYYNNIPQEWQKYSPDNTNYFFSYGYLQNETNYGYVMPIRDVTVDQVSFKLNQLTNTWNREYTNNKGKVKVQTLTSAFNAIGMYRNRTSSGELKFVVIKYFYQGKFYWKLMPGDDYIHGKYHKYLCEIFRYPNCTRSQFNTLCSFLFQTAPSYDFVLFDRQGWNEFEDGKLAFACNQPLITPSVFTESMKRRNVVKICNSLQKCTNNWMRVYANNPTLKFFGYYRIGSLLQYFFRNEGVNIKQFLIAEPSDKINANKLAALLATGDIINYPIPTLESKVENIIREHSIVFDGTVIYVDDLFVDEQEKLLSSLKALIRLTRQENRINDGNGLIAIISKSAAYTAMNLSPENTILINADEIEVEEDTSTIRNISAEMDSCTASLSSQKKELLGILQSGIGELSASQTNALRRLLSSIINKLGKNGRITCTAIINELNNGKTEETSATYESLLNRLEPLIEDIEERGMADRTWKHFLDRSRIITIIRTDPAYTESGNQLIDMMMATLYNYQCDNPQIPLDVFIDELQNQNFSKTSPIRKVLKEGRRFHISFFGATQDYYPRNTELGSVMGKAGTQIFLRPTPNSENVVASELRYRKADMLRFDSMQRGDIIVKGNLYSKESGCNIPTTLSGHVDDCPKIPSNYYGNVL